MKNILKDLKRRDHKFRIWIFPALGGNFINDHVDCIAT